MPDRATIPNAAFAVSHTWAGGKYRPDTTAWVRGSIPRLADALDMLHVCGPTFASVRAVVDAWTAALNPEQEPDRAQRFLNEWPELTNALTDLIYTSRAGRPDAS